MNMRQNLSQNLTKRVNVIQKTKAKKTNTNKIQNMRTMRMNYNQSLVMKMKITKTVMKRIMRTIILIKMKKTHTMKINLRMILTTKRRMIMIRLMVKLRAKKTRIMKTNPMKTLMLKNHLVQMDLMDMRMKMNTGKMVVTKTGVTNTSIMMILQTFRQLCYLPKGHKQRLQNFLIIILMIFR